MAARFDWRAFVVLVFVVTTASADAPDSELNPASGATESVDLASGSSNRVRHTTDKGQQGRFATLLSGSPAHNPRITIAPNGTSWVAWWKDGVTDEVYVAVREGGTGTWSAETLVSDGEQSSRHPELVQQGSSAWLSYEFDSETGRSIAVLGITDDPEPIGSPTVVGSTTYIGDLDVSLHSEGGHVWASWIHSSSEVGWSVYESGAWSVADFESYSGSSVSAARDSIRMLAIAP